MGVGVLVGGGGGVTCGGIGGRRGWVYVEGGVHGDGGMRVLEYNGFGTRGLCGGCMWEGLVE